MSALDMQFVRECAADFAVVVVALAICVVAWGLCLVVDDSAKARQKERGL